MSTQKKELDAGSRHLLRLIRKGRDAEGWAKVSAQLWPHVSKLPPELVEFRPEGDAGHIKLTEAGEIVLDWT